MILRLMFSSHAKAPSSQHVPAAAAVCTWRACLHCDYQAIDLWLWCYIAVACCAREPLHTHPLVGAGCAGCCGGDLGPGPLASAPDAAADAAAAEGVAALGTKLVAPADILPPPPPPPPPLCWLLPALPLPCSWPLLPEEESLLAELLILPPPCTPEPLPHPVIPALSAPWLAWGLGAADDTVEDD